MSRVGAAEDQQGPVKAEGGGCDRKAAASGRSIPRGCARVRLGLLLLWIWSILSQSHSSQQMSPVKMRNAAIAALSWYWTYCL